MQRPSRNDKPTQCRKAPRGLSLVEILLVVAILGLVAGATIPLFQPSLASELESAARVVSADFQRARQLAVANNSKYKLVFASDGSGYYLRHSGANASLNSLPSWPYRQASDPADRQTTLLTRLPGLADIDLIGAVRIVSSTREPVDDIEFDPNGATTRAEVTEIWLAAGNGAARRYVPITVNPVTGMTEIGEIAATVPIADDGGGGS